MRAIAYFRLEEGHDGSLAEMEKTFAQYCNLNLHQPVMTFTSVGLKKGQVDAEYRRMIEYMENSGSEFLVVVPDARHLGQDLESVARSMVELDRVRAKVTCSSEDFPDPLQNAFQTLGVKGVSRTRSRRIKESMRTRASQGHALGRPLYGYCIGSARILEVVQEEAAVVELIYRLYTKEGLGLRLIAQHLNERGISTRRGGRWNVVSIRDILRNVAYIGTYARFGMRRPNAHEAIIPAEVFRAAQDQTKMRRPFGRVMNPEPFLLSGLLNCAYCGNKMMGVTRRQSWKRKNGHRARQVYRYYQCQSRNNQSLCGYHTWRTSLLESTILNQLRYALRVKESEPRVDVSAGASRIEDVQGEKDSRARMAKRRLLRAIRRAARGDVSVKVLGEYLKELDATLDVAASVDHPGGVATTLDNWDSLDLEVRRAFLVEHLKRVTVKDDEVKITV